MAQGGETTLPKVVQGRLLEVADYQRPYAWERKQLEDLWEDLDLLGRGHHYAGTLVLKDTQEPEVMAADGDALTRYEVVDGQQRLTTCLLLLDRIRRALETLDTEGAPEVANRLRATYGLLTVDGSRSPACLWERSYRPTGSRASWGINQSPLRRWSPGSSACGRLPGTTTSASTD